MGSIKKVWRYIPFMKQPGIINMAIDEYLLNAVKNGASMSTLRFYQWSRPTASIGKNQSLSAEIDVENAEKLGVDIVRRISGGGAVLHDNEGEITYAVICKFSDFPKNYRKILEFDEKIPERYRAILEALAQGLSDLGLEIDTKRIHCPALLLHGKKISGNAQAIKGNNLLQHGTLLLTVDPEFMYSVLKAPIGKDYTRMVQSVRMKVTGLVQEWPADGIHKPPKVEVITEALKRGFEKVFGITFKEIPLSEKEWVEIKSLAENKYGTREWLEKYP